MSRDIYFRYQWDKKWECKKLERFEHETDRISRCIALCVKYLCMPLAQSKGVNAIFFLKGFGILQCWKGGLNLQCPCTNMVPFRMEMKQYCRSENVELWQAKFWL